MTWQTMNTAPKRGLIVAYAPEEVDLEKDADILPWLNYYGGEYVIVFWNKVEGEWDDGRSTYEPDYFTHWIPIPKRPKEEDYKWQIGFKSHLKQIGHSMAKYLLPNGK